MKIDMPTFKEAVNVFESRHGCLLDLLNDLTKRERRSLMRYGKLPRAILDSGDKTRIAEFLNISFEFRQILNDVMKPRSPGRAGKVRSSKCQALLLA